ncbi:hypothetical protein [Mesoflavibacter zeaxanthinifaciens]|nr:hypothetical protein [Mesoflavibacter zeaxanthinifaciens]
MKTKNIDATAISIIVSCVVVTNKALEITVLSMVNKLDLGSMMLI